MADKQVVALIESLCEAEAVKKWACRAPGQARHTLIYRCRVEQNRQSRRHCKETILRRGTAKLPRPQPACAGALVSAVPVFADQWRAVFHLRQGGQEGTELGSARASLRWFRSYVLAMSRATMYPLRLSP